MSNRVFYIEYPVRHGSRLLFKSYRKDLLMYGNYEDDDSWWRRWADTSAADDATDADYSEYEDEAQDDPQDDKYTKRTWGKSGGSYWSGRGTGGSLSGWWSRQVGGVKGWWKTSGAGEYARALRAMKKIGRIVYGKDTGFVWRNTSEYDDDNITLDPAPLKAKDEDGWTEDLLADALIGDGLSRAGHKKFIRPRLSDDPRYFLEDKAGQIASEHPEADAKGLKEVGNEIYNAADYIMAEREVTKEFPGYRGYFEGERNFKHRNKDVVQNAVNEARDEHPRHINSVVPALLWNSLRPHDPIEVDPSIQSAVDELAEEIRKVGNESEPERLLDDVTNVLKRVVDFVFESGDDDEEGSGGPQGTDNPNGLKQIANEFGMGGHSREGTDEMEVLGGGTAQKAEDMANRGYEREELHRWDPSGKPGKGDGDREPLLFHAIQKRPDKVRYDLARRAANPYIAKCKEALSFRNERHAIDEYNLRRGLVDEGNIHKLVERKLDIFRRQEIESAPDVAMGILIDQSGSMWGADGEGQSKIDVARECAVMMYEAVKDMRGVTPSVWGHTTTGYGMELGYGCMVYKYIESGEGDHATLGAIDAEGSNYDGYALKWCGERMLEIERPEVNKVLFILLDGYPAAAGYGNELGSAHVEHVTNELRRKGVSVFAIGTGGDVDDAGLARMYGKDHYILVQDPSQLPRELSRLMAKALKQGKV